MQIDESNKNKAINVIHFIEDSFIVLLIIGIVVIALSQIVLRNLFDDGIIWAESLVRVMVLWIAMTGAMIATRKGKHLKIDVLSHFSKKNDLKKIEKINNAFAFVVCLVIFYNSLRYVQTEFEYSVSAVGIIPSWIISMIIPIAFGVMSIRFFIYTIYKK